MGRDLDQKDGSVRRHREGSNMAGEQGKYPGAEDRGHVPASLEGPETPAEDLGFILRGSMDLSKIPEQRSVMTERRVQQTMEGQNSRWLGGSPGVSDGKESTCNAGDLGSIPGREDPLEKGMATHPNILARRMLERGACWATVHVVTKSR